MDFGRALREVADIYVWIQSFNHVCEAKTWLTVWPRNQLSELVIDRLTTKPTIWTGITNSHTNCAWYFIKEDENLNEIEKD